MSACALLFAMTVGAGANLTALIGGAEATLTCVKAEDSFCKLALLTEQEHTLVLKICVKQRHKQLVGLQK